MKAAAVRLLTADRSGRFFRRALNPMGFAAFVLGAIALGAMLGFMSASATNPAASSVAPVTARVLATSTMLDGGAWAEVDVEGVRSLLRGNWVKDQTVPVYPKPGAAGTQPTYTIDNPVNTAIAGAAFGWAVMGGLIGVNAWMLVFWLSQAASRATRRSNSILSAALQ